jgi:EF hand
MTRMMLTGLALLMSTGLAFAADTAPTKHTATAHPSSSGRPSAILSKSECRDVWKQAIGKKGDTLGADRATPYVANFRMVDKDQNGQISKAEFKQGCRNGWIQNVASNDNMNAHQKPGAMKNATGSEDKSGS